MTPHYQDATVRLFHGDCLDVLRELPDASVDSVVTDPPYGLGFMGKAWDDATKQGAAARLRADGDHAANPYKRSRAEYGGASYGGSHAADMRAFGDWCLLWAAECLRVLKPGGHMVAFGGTRTWHRLACAVEDAGFEIRDSIAWLYGSGFPKSLDVSKAIDKAAGAERERVALVGGALNSGTANGWNGSDPHSDTAPLAGTRQIDAPATPEAARWQGWGTALKPGFEPVVVARKPLVGTVAANVTAYGTGALNIDGCRIAGDDAPEGRLRHGGGSAHSDSMAGPLNPDIRPASPAGRWPANVVLDETQATALDHMSGERRSAGDYPSDAESRGMFGDRTQGGLYADQGGASRYFYTAKANSSERVRVDGIAHPTVKPLDLMRWLIRLITPPGGVVLEPFAGSGTTVEAAILEGFPCIAIERETDYLPLITQRINRRRDPIAAIRATGDDGGLFDLLDQEEESA